MMTQFSVPMSIDVSADVDMGVDMIIDALLERQVGKLSYVDDCSRTN